MFNYLCLKRKISNATFEMQSEFHGKLQPQSLFQPNPVYQKYIKTYLQFCLYKISFSAHSVFLLLTLKRLVSTPI